MKAPCLCTWVFLTLTSALHAQQAAPQTADAGAQPAADKTPVLPPPGEEVMTPTRHRIRFTRGLLGALARNFVNEELKTKLELTSDQEQKLGERISDRLWTMNEEQGKEFAGSAEFFFEHMIQNDGRNKPLDADSARQMAERLAPGVRSFEELFQNLSTDAQGVLDEKQTQLLDDYVSEVKKEMTRLKKTFERWSKGEVKKKETLQNLVQQMDEDPQEDSKNEEVRNAGRTARSMTDELGLAGWKRYLDGAIRVFGFDEAQTKQARELLRKTREQAETTMTDEWRKKVIANRTRRHAQWYLGDQPLEPWVFLLDQEYDALTQPVVGLGRSFRRDVAALATAAQRDKALETLRKAGADHGMRAEDMDLSFLFPASSQPEAH